MDKNLENHTSNKEIFVRSLERAFAKIGLQEHGRGLQIAKLLNVTPQAVSKWFSLEYTNYPRTEILIEIAKITNTSLDELVLGYSEDTKKAVPMMPCFTNAEDLQIYLYEDKLPKGISFLAALYDIENGFLFKNQDESMMNALSQPSFNKDMLLAFDRKREPKSGDLVLTQSNMQNPDFLFRKYVIECGEPYFVPLNNVYKSYNDSLKIIGVFRYAITHMNNL